MTGADKLSPLARELACLALGHLDAERTTCSSPADDLVGDLVVEVQRLRVITGDDAVDLDGAAQALVEALRLVDARWLDDAARASALVETLSDAGWALVRVRR